MTRQLGCGRGLFTLAAGRLFDSAGPVTRPASRTTPFWSARLLSSPCRSAVPLLRVHRPAAAAGAAAVLTDARAHAGRALGVSRGGVSDPRRRMAGAAAAIYGRPLGFAMYGDRDNGQRPRRSCWTAPASAGVRTVTSEHRLSSMAPTRATPRPFPHRNPRPAGPARYLRGAGGRGRDHGGPSHALTWTGGRHSFFAVAAFTNLGRDHLDPLHERPLRRPSLLFTPERARHEW